MKLPVSNSVFVLVIIVGFLSVCILLCALLGWYPVLVVNGRVFLDSQYQEGFSVAYHYYQPINNASQEKLTDAQLRRTLRIAVLEGFVDRVLVDQKLIKEMGRKNFFNKLNEGVNEMFLDEQTREGLSFLLSSVSRSAVEKYFLSDVIRFQLLEGRLRLDNEGDVTSWITKKRADASVLVFSSGVAWDGQGMTYKK